MRSLTTLTFHVSPVNLAVFICSLSPINCQHGNMIVGRFLVCTLIGLVLAAYGKGAESENEAQQDRDVGDRDLWSKWRAPTYEPTPFYFPTLNPTLNPTLHTLHPTLSPTLNPTYYYTPDPTRRPSPRPVWNGNGNSNKVCVGIREEKCCSRQSISANLQNRCEQWGCKCGTAPTPSWNGDGNGVCVGFKEEKCCSGQSLSANMQNKCDQWGCKCETPKPTPRPTPRPVPRPHRICNSFKYDKCCSGQSLSWNMLDKCHQWGCECGTPEPTPRPTHRKNWNGDAHENCFGFRVDLCCSGGHLSESMQDRCDRWGCQC